MTDEQIDSLADEHGYRQPDVGIEFTSQQFRAAVRAAIEMEREACAVAVESVRPTVIGGDPVAYLAIMGFAEKALAAVRTRG